MNCPKCRGKSQTRPGGHRGPTHNTRYYHCDYCHIDFSTCGPVVRILDKEKRLSYKTSREALAVLRGTVKSDLEIFGAVTEQTTNLARLMFRQYVTQRRDGAQPLKPNFNIGRKRAA